MPINELVILLSDKQQALLIEKAEAAGYQCDLEYLQLRIDEMLKDDTARLTHTES